MSGPCHGRTSPPGRPFLVLADLHLGSGPPSTERAFRSFLEYARREANGLLINGDLFDYWFGYGSVVRRGHVRLLAHLADTVEAGLPISLVGGNKDPSRWMGSFLRDDVGLTLLEGPLTIELGGKRCLVVHGDGIGDLAARMLHRAVRSRPFVALMRAVHPDGLNRFLSWRMVRPYHLTPPPTDVNDPGYRGPRIERWAEQQLDRHPQVEVVLASHAHAPVLREMRPGRFYVNTGDWLKDFTYVVLSPDQPPELRRWDVNAGVPAALPVPTEPGQQPFRTVGLNGSPGDLRAGPDKSSSACVDV